MRVGALVAALVVTICVALVATVIVIPAFLGGGGCGSGPATSGDASTATGNSAEPNTSLNQAIMAVSGDNNRLAAAMWIGTHLESNWRSRAIGAGSYGPFQIQNPRDVPPVVHSGITSEQAMDPPQATNYMLPAYLTALRKLDRTDPGLWLRDPERAAERTAYYAERPKYDYYVNRGAGTVRRAWTDTVALMESLSVSTDFSQNVTTDTATTVAVGTAPPSSGCVPGTVPGGPVGTPGVVSGDAVTLAQRVLALPEGRVRYIFGSEADIRATAEGRLVTPGSFSSEDPCSARRPVAVSAELLQVILDIAQRYEITLGSMISSHGCNGGRHPIGRAVDINYVSGVNITDTAQGDSFIPSSMQLYQEFRAFVASVLPRGSFVNGRPVNMGGLGQQQCLRPARPEQAGLNEFPDGCDHLHVDVGYPAAPSTA